MKVTFTQMDICEWQMLKKKADKELKSGKYAEVSENRKKELKIFVDKNL